MDFTFGENLVLSHKLYYYNLPMNSEATMVRYVLPHNISHDIHDTTGFHGIILVRFTLCEHLVGINMDVSDLLNNLLDQQLRSDLWPEPVRVIRVSPLGAQFELWAEGMQTRQTHRRIVNRDVLEHLNQQTTDVEAFAADAALFALGVEAHRIALGYSFDPFFAVSSSRVDPLPHQLEAVYGTLLPKPRTRFLLADDPGAGKTIMAGLLLKELTYRGTVERVLIITPANLTNQWQRELKDKFNERFDVINSDTTNSAYDDNPWLLKNHVITSLDFAKQERYRNQLERVHWDLVVVDEAHKLSATRYGKNLKKSLRYRLGEVIARTSNHLLFLTATPHQGDDEKFRLLLDLLEPDLFATRELLEEATANGENPIMLRRLKEDMTDFAGQRLFPARFVHTPAFNLTSLERRLYQRVSTYVSRHFQIAWRSKKRNIGLAMTVLQRRLASSSYAIARSLEKRLKRLQALKEDVLKLDHELLELTEDELEDLPEQERWNIENELAERLTLAKNLPDLEREIRELKALSEEAALLASFDQDRKLEKLFEILASLPKDEKLLIFTEHKDTLTYLLRILRKHHYRVSSIDGSMPLNARVAAEREFAGDSQVMVATEAAGEGINLQFCAVMVNYDLPWNPTRLEQRMGRVHRYGQDREVNIYNLVAQDTREGEVLGRLLTKLEHMRAQLGSDRVYDVVGKLLADINLERLITEHLSGRKTLAEIHSLMDARLDSDRADYLRDITLEALAERHLDLSRLRQQKQTSELQRLQPEYIERFFRVAFTRLGGSITPRQDGYVRLSIPYTLRHIAQQPLPNEYPKATFDPKSDRDTTLVAPGQALFDAVRTITFTQASHTLQQGARFYLPHSQQIGLLAHLELAMIDGSGTTVSRRLYACLQEDTIRALPTNVLVDALAYKKDSNHTSNNPDNHTSNDVGNEANDPDTSADAGTFMVTNSSTGNSTTHHNSNTGNSNTANSDSKPST